jgi:gliding motility-associated-like protein
LASDNVVLTLTAESLTGCGKVTDSMKLYFDKVTKVDAGSDQKACTNEIVLISTAAVKNAQSLKWTTNGKGMLGNATNLTPTYTPSTGEVGKVKFVLTASNAGQCGNYTAVDSCFVTFVIGVSVDMMKSKTVFIKSITTLSATVAEGSGQFTYQWSPSYSVTNPNSATTDTRPLTSNSKFVLTVTDVNTGCKAQGEVYITVENNVDHVIKIYNTLSPNGDGINDVWWVDGIENFPDNKVMIFNRWGDHIIELHNYDNNNIAWDGKNKQGKQVPDGTYYYVLTIDAENKSYTGWISVRNTGN